MKTLILSCLAATAVISFSGCETTDETYIAPAPATTRTTTTEETTTTRHPGVTTHTETTHSY